MLQLRIKQTKDCDSVVRLHWKIFEGDSINDLFNEKGSWCWLVFDGKKPVGFASLCECDSEIAFFTRAGVLKEYRGMGLQKRLIRVRERFCRKRGYRKIITYTLVDNPVSSNNLFNMGFKLFQPEWPWVGEKVNYFIKEL